MGKAAKPQLARAVKGPEEAYNIMKGRNFVVETKFDGTAALPVFFAICIQSYRLVLFQHGWVLCIMCCVCSGERMQVHVTEDEVRYYSRRGIEHGTYSSYTMLDSFVRKQLKETDVILDGEVVVWNKTK